MEDKKSSSEPFYAHLSNNNLTNNKDYVHESQHSKLSTLNWF